MDNGFHGSRFSFLKVGHPSMYFHGTCHVLPWKLVETAMEVGLFPWKKTWKKSWKKHGKNHGKIHGSMPNFHGGSELAPNLLPFYFNFASVEAGFSSMEVGFTSVKTEFTSTWKRNGRPGGSLHGR